MGKGLGSIRGAAERVWGRGRGWAEKLAAQIRPRVSLAAGSTLVLLTLFLPIAYEACGPPRKGYEFLRGEGIWPGVLSFVVHWGERGFYLLALGLAAFTILLVVISSRRPESLRKRAPITWLFAIAGALALFVTADFFWIFLGLWMESLLKWLGAREDISVAAVAAVTFLVLVACLRSRFLRRQRWILVLFSIASVLSLLVIANFFLSLFRPYSFLPDDLPFWMMMAPPGLYWLVPVVLWFRFGLSRRDELRAQWPGIRLRVIQMYVPVMLADCLFFVDVVKMGLWGFLPFFLGLYLMSLGYMGLAGEATRSPTPGPVTVP